jgi:hypothetical protein
LNCNPDAKEFFSPFSFSLPLLEHLLVKLSPEERLHDEYGTHELRRGMQNQTDNWVVSMPRRETISGSSLFSVGKEGRQGKIWNSAVTDA